MIWQTRARTTRKASAAPRCRLPNDAPRIRFGFIAFFFLCRVETRPLADHALDNSTSLTERPAVREGFGKARTGGSRDQTDPNRNSEHGRRREVCKRDPGSEQPEGNRGRGAREKGASRWRSRTAITTGEWPALSLLSLFQLGRKLDQVGSSFGTMQRRL